MHHRVETLLLLCVSVCVCGSKLWQRVASCSVAGCVAQRLRTDLRRRVLTLAPGESSQICPCGCVHVRLYGWSVRRAASGG
jgi:hypothetical protein